MQTHRIPQHVTGYQGRIMGRLNAKQFIYMAIGGILVFIILTTFPLSIVTIVLVAIIAFVSFIFALFKIQDRSLDEWLINFVLALQSTPQLVWEKTPAVPEILLSEYRPQTTQPLRATAAQKKIDNFLQFWGTEAGTNLTEYEEEAMQRIKRLQPEV